MTLILFILPCQHDQATIFAIGTSSGICCINDITIGWNIGVLVPRSHCSRSGHCCSANNCIIRISASISSQTQTPLCTLSFVYGHSCVLFVAGSNSYCWFLLGLYFSFLPHCSLEWGIAANLTRSRQRVYRQITYLFYGVYCTALA